MIRITSTRCAAFALSVAAGVGLVGCGNGLEVSGPSKVSGSHLTSPAPTSVVSPTGGATSAPATPSGRGSTQTGPASAPAQSPTSGGSHNGGSDNGGGQGGKAGKDNTGTNTGGSNTGSNSQAGGAQTSAAPASTGGRQQSGQDGIPACGLGDLAVGVRVPAGGGAAGSQYVLLTFTNTSRRPCTMYGYAGVSFVGHQDGTQLGEPAVRDHSRSSQQVRLAPGNTKSELVRITAAGNFDPTTCQPTSSDGFRVYPPGSYSAAYVPFNTSACQGKVAQLTVYPVGATA